MSMLDGLDDVPWKELTHAYGSAEDVPGILRALASGDEDALWQLYGNIWHQGTVYEATANAVPFLVELLEAGETDTAGVMGLLQAIAAGSSYMDVHRDYEPRSKRYSEETEQRIAKELGWVRAAHEAVVDGVPSYLRQLSDGDEEARSAAAWVLGTCREAADRVVGAMMEGMAREESGLVRGALVLALADLGAATDERLAAWMRDPDPTPRCVAALSAALRPGPLGPEVCEVLEKSAPEAMEALQELGRFSQAGGDVLNYLIEDLRDRPDLQIALLTAWMGHEKAEVRAQAVFAVETVMHARRSAAARLVPELAKRLQDPDRDVRYWAASHIADSGRAAVLAADAMWNLLQKEKLTANSPAAFALYGLCRMRDPRVAGNLKKVWEKRLRARKGIPEPTGHAIAYLGSWAPDLLDVLIRLIPVAEPGNTKIHVIQAVGSFGPAAGALPAIRAELEDHPHIVTRVLGDFGPAAADAVADLEGMLDHNDAQVRINAARALFKITGDAARALAVLKDDIVQAGGEDAGPHRSGLSAALSVLAEMGRAAGELADVLPPLFHSDDEWVSVRSAVAYWRLTGDAGAVVPVLLEHVECVPRGFEAVRCLADIGPAARAALPRLQEMAESEERQGGIGDTKTWIERDEAWQELCRQAVAWIGG